MKGLIRSKELICIIFFPLKRHFDFFTNLFRFPSNPNGRRNRCSISYNQLLVHRIRQTHTRPRWSFHSFVDKRTKTYLRYSRNPALIIDKAEFNKKTSIIITSLTFWISLKCKERKKFSFVYNIFKIYKSTHWN